MKEIIIISHVLNDSVTQGFIPAAQKMGLATVLVTDYPEAHRAYFAQDDLPAYPAAIIGCDVFNPLAVIDVLSKRQGSPVTVFSNSDHLQASTAIVADYFGLPGKDWRAALYCKNKAAMRQKLADFGLETVWHKVIYDLSGLDDTRIPFPCIVKPREGVASENVRLANNVEELTRYCAQIWAKQLGRPLLLEEYLEGQVYTLETLGDNRKMIVLGGFSVRLSPPPYFVELNAKWLEQPPMADQIVAMINRLGVRFGSCHTEYIVTEQGPKLIEVNYRLIGDYRDFLLQDSLNLALFESILSIHLEGRLPELNPATTAAEIRYFTATENGEVVKAPSAFRHVAPQATVQFRPIKKVGNRVQISHSNKDYVGILTGFGLDHSLLDRAFEHSLTDLHWEIRP